MKSSDSKDKSNRKDRNKGGKSQPTSAKKPLPPKAQKKHLQSQQPSIKDFTLIKQPTLKQIEAGEKLLSLIQYKQKQLLSQTFNYLTTGQNTENDSQSSLQKLSNLLEHRTQNNLQSSLNAIQQFEHSGSMRSSNDIQFEETLSKQQIEELKDGLKQLEPYSSQNHQKTKTYYKTPIQSMDYIKTQPDVITPSSRSVDIKKKLASKNKEQNQASVDLPRGDLDDLRKITLSQETKLALVKLQKYDKDFSKNINQKHLRGILQAECKRQEKIKSINRSMRVMTYDNQLTINAVVNILKYQGDLNRDIREKEVLSEQNEQLHNKINELSKLKNDQIKELKLSLKSKSGDENTRNKVLDAQIKDFRKTNDMLIPALKQGNFEKARKLMQPQIKKLSNSNNKQIAFERKQLLEIILSLISTQTKSQNHIESNIPSSSSLISSLNTQLAPLFEAQSSIERNISHLQKCRRLYQSKIQDIRLFQTKQLYQTLSQGSNYLISLYQQLRDKNNTIVSQNRKMADMQRIIQRSDRLRVESVEKGDKIIQGLKDGLERQRKQSREIMHRLNSTNKSIKDQQEKVLDIKLPQILEDWVEVLEGIIDKLEKDDRTWSSDLTNLKKRFLHKKQTSNQFKTIIINDVTLLDVLTRKDKYIQKTQQTNQQLQKKLSSNDTKLQFKPSEIQKKYSIQKQKTEQLILQKNALLKQLKQMQRQNQKNKDPQFDEILQLNKICYNIDSLLKIPFSKDSWTKIQFKLQNKGQLKNLNSIGNTLQNLYNRMYEYLCLNKPIIKEPKSHPAVKQFVNQPSRERIYTQYPQISKLLQRLVEVLENEPQIERQIQLVERIPFLLNLLDQKILENEENIKKIQRLQLQLSLINTKIQELQTQLRRTSEKTDGDKSLQSSRQQLHQNILKLTQEIEQMRQRNQSIREECYFKIMKMKDEGFKQKEEQNQKEKNYKNREQDYQKKMQLFEQQIRKQRQVLFYKSRMLEETQRQIEIVRKNQSLWQKRVAQLEQQLEIINISVQVKEKEREKQKNVEQVVSRIVKQKDIQTQNQSKGNTEAQIQTEISIVQQASSMKQIIDRVQIIQNLAQTEDEEQNKNIRSELLQAQNDQALKQEHILHLKQWILDKENIITNLEESQCFLKTQLKLAESELKSMRKPQIPSPGNFPVGTEHLQQISQLQLSKNELQNQVKDYYDMSEKYRVMFQDCCKQMEELHQNSQEQMQSLTEMHLRNQKLLEEEIDLLKKEKTKLINKIQEFQRSFNGLQKQTKRQQMKHIIQIKKLEGEYEQLANDNSQMLEDLRQVNKENINLKQRILILEKQKTAQEDNSEDMRKSFNSVLDKRKKRLQSRASDKPNPPSDSGMQLSAKLSNLLHSQGKHSASALRTIIQAINKLILSNKRLIQRVKRTQRQNNALYQAINNLTQNQQEVGQGIAVIMHLQQVLADLVQWLDDESIATEEDLKLGHFFQRLQGCLSKNNYFRYVQIFEQFLQHTIVIAFQRSQQQLRIQNKQIDSLREKLMVALDQHLHDIIDEGETEGDEAQVLGQVRVLLGVYLKTRNLKVIEDLVTILNVDQMSFG